MRVLKKLHGKGTTHRQTDTRTSRLLDQLGPEGPEGRVGDNPNLVMRWFSQSKLSNLFVRWLFVSTNGIKMPFFGLVNIKKFKFNAHW